MDTPRASSTARPHVRALAGLTLSVSFCGCAQPGPIAQRNALVGSLRESVSQLESEKQKLERQVVALDASNRRLEDRLVQEQAHAEALETRLDRSRQVASGGIPFPEELDTEAASLPRRDASRQVVPARRPTRRPAPFATIPGVRFEPESEADGRLPSHRPTSLTPLENGPAGDDLFSPARDTVSRRDAHDPWLASEYPRARAE